MMNLWPYAVLSVSLLRFFLRRRGDWTQAILKSNIWHSKNINKQKRCYHALDGAAVNSRPPASSSNPVWTGTVNHFKPSSSNQGNLARKNDGGIFGNRSVDTNLKPVGYRQYKLEIVLAVLRYNLLWVFNLHLKNNVFRDFKKLRGSTISLQYQGQNVKSAPFSFPTKRLTKLSDKGKRTYY